MRILNKSQREYISSQLAVVASILLGTLVLGQFTEKGFNRTIFLISLGIALAFYIAGVMLRYNFDG